MAVKFTLLDLQHILAQIQMAETGQLPVSPHLAFGLRQVQGTLNNTVPGNQNFGAADQPFSTATSQFFQTVTVNVDGTIFDAHPETDGDTITTSYAIANPNAAPALSGGTVIDTGPRTVSNLISDISINNPAALQTAQEFGAQLGDGYTVLATNPSGLTMPGADGIFGTPDDILPGDTQNLFIGNITPDAGLSAPFNNWMTFFGQFFDHGLDLITKGGSGTVLIPLMPDDPLIAGADGNFGTEDDLAESLRFMALTRATTSVVSGGADGIIGDNLGTTDVNEAADDVHQFINTTTPFVDQNQTYSSTPSHQVFLREYMVGVDGKLHSTGKLLQHAEGPDGDIDTLADNNTGMATWADVKANALKLGILLTDYNVGNVPMLVTDAYGNFIAGPSGFAQIMTATGSVEGVPGGLPLPNNTLWTGHAFINDMAETASPFPHGPGILTADADDIAGKIPNPAFNSELPVGPDNLEFLAQPAGTYDDELLDAHYIAGDGRVNENVGLTAVHEIFHSEHNRLVDQTKALIQAQVDAGNTAFAADWVLPGTNFSLINGVDGLGNPTHIIQDSEWNGERLFQTAKFGTETQYQHLVFEEFARKVAPTIHLFGNNDIHLDPSIMSEFANAVYRFGHSMLDENVPIYVLDANGLPIIDTQQFRALTVDIPVADEGGLSHTVVTGLDDNADNLTGVNFPDAAWELFQGLGDDDFIVGNGGNDQFVGGAGNDDITGGSDNDTYFYNSLTDGSDFITELGSNDAIVLTDDVALADISLQKSPSDELVITFRAGQPNQTTLTITNFFGDTNSQVEKIIFATGANQGSYIDLSDSHLQSQLSFNNPIIPSLAMEANPLFGQAQLTTMGLIEAFTNPLGFASLGADAANAIVQGTTHQIGSEIDEFVTGALRNNLLGLPLDLAALNIARGRETGVAPLNLVRAQIFAGTGDMTLKPYESWYEFGQFLKHPASLVNFVAAYGTHSSITSATTLVDKRAAAADLVGLGIDPDSALQPVGSFAHEAYDFMHSIGVYAADVDSPIAVQAQWSTGNVTGLDNVDLWIGGLAEKQNLFGGLLGSTFNFIFETQLENLQDGDRLYYLPRIEGMDYGTQIENNSFADMIIANTGARHIPAAVFLTPEYTVEAGLVTADQSTWLKNPVTGAYLVERLPDGTVHFIGDDNFFGNTIVLGGTEGNDRLQSGHADDDTVWGDGGNDWIDGGNGNDFLYGGTGNDTFVDSGGDDVIHGEDGDDTIDGGIGDDLIFGGDGDDLIHTGSAILGDEVQGGAGNDIAYGSDADDALIGNEGDDWLSGGGGGDGLVGDTGAPTGQVPLFAGNDVLDGGRNGDKMVGFSGDDIMLGLGGFDKFNGLLGFDWADFEQEESGVSVDMERREFIPNQQQLAGDAVRDFFIETEATSGSAFGDFIQGTEDAGRAAGVFNELTNVDLITNLDTFFLGGEAYDWDATGAVVPPVAPAVAGFSTGNILLGGDGSDIITGRAGNDLIDGDAWLHVELSNNLPGAQIIREIRSDVTAGDVDTAVYRDVITAYSITGPDADGFWLIAHNTPTAGVPNDGVDRIRNIERLQFADPTSPTGTVTVLLNPTASSNQIPTGQLLLVDNDANAATPVVATVGTALSIDLLNTNIADLDGIQPGTLHYTWQRQVIAAGGGTSWLNIDRPVGVDETTYTPQQFVLGNPLRVVATFLDGKGVLETVVSAPTALTAPDLNVNTAPFINPQQNPPGLPDTTANTVTPINLFLPLTSVFGDNETAVGALTFAAKVTLPGGAQEVLLDGIPGATTGLVFHVITAAGLVTGATLTGNLSSVGAVPITISATDQGTPNLAVPGTFLPGTQLTVNDTFLINVTAGNQPPQLGAAEAVFAADEGTLFLGALSGHPVDPDGPSPVVYQLVEGSEVNGVVVINPVTGAYQFTPADGLSSDDLTDPVPQFSFQYRLFDGLSYSDIRTVTGDVNAIDNGTAVIRITGTAAAGGTLSAVIGDDVNLPDMGNDPDGLVQSGSETYQWYRDGAEILGATSVDLVLTDADVGHNFAVHVSYMDGQGFTDEATSATTSDVGFVSATGLAAKPVSLQREVTGDASMLWDPDNGILIETASYTFDVSSDGGLTWNPILSPVTDISATLASTATVGPDNYVRANITYIDGLGNLNTALGQATHYMVDATGANALTGTAARDLIYGNGGNDTINGGLGDDFVQGGGGNDRFIASAGDGNDTYDGGTIGALGNQDTYDLSGVAGNADVTLGNTLPTSDPASTIGLAVSDAGTDQLFNIEWVIGSQGANTIIGNEVGNRLTGLGGNDLLDAGTGGSDTLIGGLGDDTYVIDHASVSITENVGEGSDEVRAAITFSIAAFAAVENLTLTGVDNINATGNALANVITGNQGANILNGGTGADTLIGGDGNDTFNVDHDGMTLVENAGEGTDTVVTLTGTAGTSFTLGANFENLTMTSGTVVTGIGNELANVITGNTNANTLDSGSDFIGGLGDTLIGGAGNDTYIVRHGSVTLTEAAAAGTDVVQSFVSFSLATNFESLVLQGSADINGTSAGTAAQSLTGNSGNNVLFGGNDTLADTLIGGSGNDTLDAGNSAVAAADSLAGGIGDDVYVVNHTGMTLLENAGEGTDTVSSSITFTLGANFDNLTLTGVAAINGTGNTLDNLIIGNGVANTLNAGTAGTDTLQGGGGNDIYTVDHLGVTVLENAGEGTDLVNSSVDFILLDNVDNLTLTGTAVAGTGNLGSNVITGNASGNLLNGGGNGNIVAAADTLAGGGGNDTYVVDNTNVTLTEGGAAGTDLVRTSVGNAGVTFTLATNFENLELTGVSAINGTGNTVANVITGNAAANILDGGTGSIVDTLSGGAGNDTFLWTVGLGADVIDGGADADTLTVSGAAGTANDTLTVTLVGAALSNVTGATLSNVETINVDLGGNTTGDTLIYATASTAATVDLSTNSASGFASLLNVENVTGGNGNDLIRGNAGANVLNGGGGTDTISYSNATGAVTVTLALTTAQNTVGAGSDTISNFENLTGSAFADTLTGSAGTNVIDGGAGADSINGGAGADTLVGGDGADTINTGSGGVATENVTDIIKFVASTEYGDTINSFDASGTAAQVDHVRFSGALDTLFDDIGAVNAAIVFATGNGAAGPIAANITATHEALMLTGVGGEGVTNANLGNAALVAAAFNLEFTFTAAVGDDALLVINDTDGTSASMWQWIENGTAGIQAGELTYIGQINADTTVTANSFDFLSGP